MQDSPEPGLRERKKARTRETISRVALELFAARGYDATSLDDIATAADVAKRTIFAYYQSKEDILFSDEPWVLAEIARALDERPPGTSAADALARLLVDFVPTAQGPLRKRIIGNDPALRLRERARFSRSEEILATAIARDLDVEPVELRVRLLAASVSAAFSVAYDYLLTQMVDDADCGEFAARPAFDQVIELLRTGVETLRRR